MKRCPSCGNSLIAVLPFSATILLALFPSTAVGAGITITYPDVPGEVVIEWVTIGDAGNDADDTGFGAVGHVYRIGRYEITNSQYAEFLNTVDPEGSNAHGIYNANMGSGWNDIGGIAFDPGAANGSKYVVRPGRGNRPVDYVSWYDAARLCNWLAGGDTETGSYDLTGGDTMSVVRDTGARYVIPTGHEWYKAAYYKGGGTSAGYWEYPTQSDTAPTWEVPPGTDPVNGSANYYDGSYLDATYYTTEVGAYTIKPSDSAYGTFDQGGNVGEWNETAIVGAYRGVRGGGFDGGGSALAAGYRDGSNPTDEEPGIGFRIALVSVPGDSDGDGDADLDDYRNLGGCLLGPDGDLEGNCDYFDVDDNDHVDLNDVAAFQRAFTGWR